MWLWLFNAPSGYHQLAEALDSQEKLAFQGPNAIKWMYLVMPFGRPAMFISFIYDANSQWKSLATATGITIGDNTNTQIICWELIDPIAPI
jgi:hypothetical protein